MLRLCGIVNEVNRFPDVCDEGKFRSVIIIVVVLGDFHPSKGRSRNPTHLLKRVLVPGNGAEEQGGGRGRDDDERNSKHRQEKQGEEQPGRSGGAVPLAASEHLWVKVSIVVRLLQVRRCKHSVNASHDRLSNHGGKKKEEEK